MRGPVPGIQRIRLLKAIDDTLDAGWAEDPQGLGTTAGPGLQVELAQVTDMVRVKVREEDAPDARWVDARQCKAVPRAWSRVHNPELAACIHRDAGFGARRMRQRRCRTTEQRAERVFF